MPKAENVWPRQQRGLSPFAVRFWLVAALIALVSALILGANLVLLGYAQPRSDPVGQLTPARLMQIEHELPGKSGTTSTAVIPQPPPHDKHIAGERSDD
jgi:hypothetical protein